MTLARHVRFLAAALLLSLLGNALAFTGCTSPPAPPAPPAHLAGAVGPEQLPQASTAARGVVRLTRDLGGDAGAPEVVGIAGLLIDGGPPDAGYALVTTAAGTWSYALAGSGASAPSLGVGTRSYLWRLGDVASGTSFPNSGTAGVAPLTATVSGAGFLGWQVDHGLLFQAGAPSDNIAAGVLGSPAGTGPFSVGAVSQQATSYASDAGSPAALSVVLQLYSLAGPNVAIYWDPSNGWTMEAQPIGSGTTASAGLGGAAVPPASTSHHVITYGGSGDATFRYYLDGVLVGSIATGILSAPLDHLAVANNSGLTSYGTPCVISDVFIDTVAETAGQIQADTVTERNYRPGAWGAGH